MLTGKTILVVSKETNTTKHFQLRTFDLNKQEKKWHELPNILVTDGDLIKALDEAVLGEYLLVDGENYMVSMATP